MQADVHRPICVYNLTPSHHRISAEDLNIQGTNDANTDSLSWLTKERGEETGMQDISAAFIFWLNVASFLWFHEKENKDIGGGYNLKTF